jgi:hypothetical protein
MVAIEIRATDETVANLVRALEENASMPNDPSVIGRTKAQSGRTSFSRPIVIRGPGKPTYFEVLLQYIPHSARPDALSVKVRYWKQQKGAFRVGFPAEFTLDEDEAKHLRDVLDQGLAVAGTGSDGEYFLVPLGTTPPNLAGRDPAQVGRALSSILMSDEVLDALQEDPRGLRLLARLQGAVRIG